MFLLGSLAKPKRGFSAVHWNALAAGVAASKPELSFHVSLFGGLAKPKRGSLVIRWNALADVVAESKQVLGLHVSLLGQQ